MTDDFGFGTIFGGVVGALLVLFLVAVGGEWVSVPAIIDRGPCASLMADDRCDRVADGEIETWACSWSEGSKVRVVRCEEVEPLAVPVRGSDPEPLPPAPPAPPSQVIINNSNMQGE